MGFFEDDTYIRLSASKQDIEFAIKLIEVDCKAILSTFSSSKLKANIDKTKAIYSHPPVHIVRVFIINIAFILTAIPLNFSQI